MAVSTGIVTLEKKEKKGKQQIEKNFPEHIQIFSWLFFCSIHTGARVALIAMLQMSQRAENIEKGKAEVTRQSSLRFSFPFGREKKIIIIVCLVR